MFYKRTHQGAIFLCGCSLYLYELYALWIKCTKIPLNQWLLQVFSFSLSCKTLSQTPRSWIHLILTLNRKLHSRFCQNFETLPRSGGLINQNLQKFKMSSKHFEMWITIEITRADQSSGARNMIMVGRLCLLNKQNIANRAKLKFFGVIFLLMILWGMGCPKKLKV